jgi:type IV pilus assembly protein PilF
MIKRLLSGCIAIGIMAGFFGCATVDPQRIKQSEAVRAVGEAYMTEGNFTRALQELTKAEKLYSEDHLLQDDLGLVYMAKHRPDLAIEAFKRALKIKPDYSPAVNNLGTAYLASGEVDKAITIFEKLSGNLLYETPHFPLYNLGRAYYIKKDYPRALKYFQEALQTSPGFVEARRWIGRTLIKLGRYPEATVALERAAKLSPDFAALYFDLGHLYTLTGELARARQAFQRVLKLAPKESRLNEEANKMLDMIGKK